MYLFKVMKRLVNKKKKKFRGRRFLRKRNTPQSPADSGDELNSARIPSSNGLEVRRSSKDLSPLTMLTSRPSSCFQEMEQPDSGYTSMQEMQVEATIEQEVSLRSIASEQMQCTADYGRNVQLVELRLSPDSKLSGTVMVKNLAYHKNIFIRWTTDNWASHQDLVASYDRSSEGFTHDWFSFSTESPLLQKGEDGVCVELAVAYQVNWMEFWDNNQGNNFELLLK